MSKKRLYAGSLALVCIIASALFAASQNFVPDKTFQGPDLSGWHALGDADWRADNGKITGTPKRESGGWLVLDHGLQDVELSAAFHCSGAEFVPELIHNRSGVGSHLAVADLNHDGAIDIITSTNRGAFIFWNQMHAAKRVASKK